MKNVQVDLSEAGIQKMIDELNSFEKWLNQKADEFLRYLSEYGCEVAQASLNQAIYSAEGNDISLSIEASKDGYILKADGTDVLFLEFGAGVHYNGSGDEEQFSTIASGKVYRIGEYGKGRGKRDAWYYYPNGDKSLGAVRTHGNPAGKPLYSARKAISRDANMIAKGVFNYQ